MARRGWLVLWLVLLVVGAGFAFLTHRLLYTQAGLDLALRQLARVPGMRIEVTGARGTLAGPLAAERIVVDHEALYAEVRDLRVVSSPRALIAGRVTLDELQVGSATVRLKDRPEPPESDPHFLPRGLSLHADGFRIGTIDLTLQDGSRIDIREARGDLSLTRWRLDLDPLFLAAEQGNIEGSLALRATEPLGLRTNLQGQWRFPDDEFTYRFRVATRGHLDRLGAELHLDAPARVSFSGTLLDLTESPRARGTLRIDAFDGSPWLSPDSLPTLSGTIALAAGRRGIGLDGTLTSPELPGQQLRLRGGGRFADRRIDVARFRAWLPRIGASVSAQGNVQLPDADAPEGTLPAISFTGEWSELRWPLDPGTEPVVTSTQGRYTFEGSLPYAFTVSAAVSGPDVPPVEFDARGSVARDGLTLQGLDARTLDGRIQGSGTLAWTGEQRWRFEVDARSLALGQLREGLTGRLNARGSIQGSGLTAQAPWTAQLSSLSGTLLGRPLTGRGQVAHRDGTYELRDVRLANGASFADVNGRVGATSLALDWRLDLRTLALVAEGMQGELVSRGHARGSLRRPELQATAELRRFTYGGLTIAAASAEADVDTSDRRRSRASVEATNVASDGLVFDTVRAGLDGTLAEHEVAFAFSSPGEKERSITEFRGGLAARGALDYERRTWTGDLVQADVVFADGAARLLQPAALVLGPDLQRVAPLCLRTDLDARACVEGERKAKPASWRFLYSAQDWPLQRLLRSLFGWREFDGRLQASGWAEQVPGKPWVGGSTVLIHEPALEVPRNKFRRERIELGSSRLDLYAEPEAIRASLDLRVDDTTDVTGEARLDRRADLRESPLTGTLTGRSGAIALLPLLIPELDRATGRLGAQIRLSGTLAEPQFDGSFDLRDGRLDFYRTNLVLADVQADGRFTGDELVFKASGQTPKGRLDVDGNFGWPQGVMTGVMRMRGDELLVADTPDFRVVASPDIVVYAGRAGFDVQGEVVVPTARISPRQLTTTVNASPDERVVGVAEVVEEEPSTTDRVTSTIRVRLGDTVRVDAYGLTARLEGEIVVSTVPEDVARGNGVIRIVDGEYRAFGQAVRITKGELRFADSPLDEPVIDLVAEREIRDADVTVAVNVRGPIANPFVTITSTPAMPSNEALSYLLTGRSIDTLQSGEAADVNQAAENLALSGGGLLLGNLGKRIGLDEVSVERTGDDDTAVVFGKALSPKLYVSYGIAIAEAINTIKLRYTLNKRWAVKAEAGLDQSVDVEYRIEQDRIRPRR